MLFRSPVRRSIVFPAGGRAEETVRIDIIDNSACESAEENFFVSLLSPDSSVVLEGNATVTIVEDDSMSVCLSVSVCVYLSV